MLGKCKLKGWHCQLILLILIILVVVIKLYPAYTYRLDDEPIKKIELIGCWIQTDDSAKKVFKEAMPLNKRPCIFLDSKGNYYQDFDYPEKSDDSKRWGTWHFRSEKSILGYKNWVMLGRPNFDSDKQWSNPHFFLKKKNGQLLLYGDYLPKDLMKFEFSKSNHIDLDRIERIKKYYKRAL